MRAYLQLVRLPNVFTAMADVLLGYLFTHPRLEPVGHFALLLVASSMLYLAGMVLNDYFDQEQDARERPARPLPSGRVTPQAARLLGGAVAFGRRGLRLGGDCGGRRSATRCGGHVAGRGRGALRRRAQTNSAGAGGDGRLPHAQRAAGTEPLARPLAGGALRAGGGRRTCTSPASHCLPAPKPAPAAVVNWRRAC